MKSFPLKRLLVGFLALSAMNVALATPTFTLRVPAMGLRPTSAAPAQQASSWVVDGSPATAFSTTTVGSYASPDLTFNVRNTGTQAGNFTIPSFTGSDAADFTANGTCSNIGAGQLCPVTVRFKPSRAAAEAASLQVGTSPTLSFTGTGSAAVSDPYYANIALLVHMDGVDAGTAFPSQKGPTLSPSGVVTSTTGPKLGTASARIANSGYMATTMTSGLNLGAHSTWTAEYFFKTDGFSGVMLAGFLNSNVRWTFEVINSSQVLVLTDNNTAVKFTVPQTMSTGTWYHLAVVRQSGATRVFLNGQEASPSGSTSANVSDVSGGTFNIGRMGTNAYFFTGNIDELRITPDVARYTGPFTPPTQAFPNQ